MNKPDQKSWRDPPFSQIPMKVLADTKLTASHKVVLAALIGHCHNGKDWCNPSIPTLASETNFGPRYVRRLVAELKELGAISITKPGRYNIYDLRPLTLFLNPPEIDLVPENTPKPKPELTPEDLQMLANIGLSAIRN